MRYLTAAPLLLYAVALYFYFSSLTDAQLRTRETFWLLIVDLLVVPTAYGVLMAVFRVRFVPLVRR